MSTKEKMDPKLKGFVAAMILVVIACFFVLAGTWISTGDDTARYFGTAAFVGIPAAICALATGVDIWSD